MSTTRSSCTTRERAERFREMPRVRDTCLHAFVVFNVSCYRGLCPVRVSRYTTPALTRGLVRAGPRAALQARPCLRRGGVPPGLARLALHVVVGVLPRGAVGAHAAVLERELAALARVARRLALQRLVAPEGAQGAGIGPGRRLRERCEVANRAGHAGDIGRVEPLSRGARNGGRQRRVLEGCKRCKDTAAWWGEEGTEDQKGTE